jgi:hypothetical protein
MMKRHARQSRLAEVGERGQAKLAAAAVHVAPRGFAGVVAAKYLAGAGIGALRVRDEEARAAAVAVDPAVAVTAGEVAHAPVDLAPFGAKEEAASAFLEGAAFALRAIKERL